MSKKDPEIVTVQPAWRKSLRHVVLSTPVHMDSTASESRQTTKRLTRTKRWLRDATPRSGSHMNEADSDGADWQRAFLSSHYATLKQIKYKVDPTHLFIFHHYVGSVEWDESLNCRIS